MNTLNKKYPSNKYPKGRFTKEDVIFLIKMVNIDKRFNFAMNYFCLPKD